MRIILAVVAIPILLIPGCMSSSTSSGGSGSATGMSSGKKSLYERLNGEPAIAAVVDKFVGKAAGDPKVNFTRKGTPKEWQATPENVDHLKRMLVEFIGMATGGPQKYTGKAMKPVHEGMQITDAEFSAIAADLQAVLDEMKVPAAEAGELMAIVASTRGDIVQK